MLNLQNRFSRFSGDVWGTIITPTNSYLRENCTIVYNNDYFSNLASVWLTGGKESHRPSKNFWVAENVMMKGVNWNLNLVEMCQILYLETKAGSFCRPLLSWPFWNLVGDSLNFFESQFHFCMIFLESCQWCLPRIFPLLMHFHGEANEHVLTVAFEFRLV